MTLTTGTLEETLRTRMQWEYPYSVTVHPTKVYDYDAISQWCKDKSITEYRIHLIETRKWSFKWEQDALLFSLKWQ